MRQILLDPAAPTSVRNWYSAATPIDAMVLYGHRECDWSDLIRSICVPRRGR